MEKVPFQYVCAQSHPTPCNPMNYIAHHAPLSMEFSCQEFWSGSPFPPPGDSLQTMHKMWMCHLHQIPTVWLLVQDVRCQKMLRVLPPLSTMCFPAW